MKLNISPVPTESYTQQIFVPNNNQPGFVIKNAEYVIAYTDPTTLSYDTFENILDLDFMLKDINISTKKIKENDKVFTCKLNKNNLMDLHNTDLYSTPTNNNTRGGKRMIFSSINLSNQLTKLFKDHEVLGKDFVTVNHVFRLNHFTPSDKKFKSHFDTSFADKAQDHYSKYTLLIYLTSGEGKDLLKIEDQSINSIDAMTCIIFDQKYEHEGNPYKEGDKIFIRTELIYKIDVYYSTKAATYFNKACYFTKEGIISNSPEYQQHSSDLFNKVAALRHSKTYKDVKEKYLIKKCMNVVFVTNGENYWFSKNNNLIDIAKIIVLDYFNGKGFINSQNIKICSKECYVTDEDNIFNKINDMSFEDDKIIDKFENIEKLIPRMEDHLDEPVMGFCGMDFCDNKNDGKHTIGYFYYEDEYASAVNKLKKQNMSLMLFGDKMFIDSSKIKIDAEKNKIIFNASLEKSINFAACQCGIIFYKEDVMCKKTEFADGFLMPDIDYIETDKGYKLSIDMFKNGFIYRSKVEFDIPYVDFNKNRSKSE